MSSHGSITLGELEGKLTLLEIACHRCERRARVGLARLIEEHGADTLGFPILGKSRGRLPVPRRPSSRKFTRERCASCSLWDAIRVTS